MPETKKIRVTAKWISHHDFVVPASADARDIDGLKKLMALIAQDPDGEGDISPISAELVDWQVHC